MNLENLINIKVIHSTFRFLVKTIYNSMNF